MRRPRPQWEAMGDSLAVKLSALTRASLVRIQVPQPNKASSSRSRPAWGSGCSAGQAASRAGLAIRGEPARRPPDPSPMGNPGAPDHRLMQSYCFRHRHVTVGKMHAGGIPHPIEQRNQLIAGGRILNPGVRDHDPGQYLRQNAQCVTVLGVFFVEQGGGGAAGPARWRAWAARRSPAASAGRPAVGSCSAWFGSW